jgi:hypothetical protein
MTRVNDQLWRLEAVSDLTGLGAAVPVLRLGYTPHQLYFLARGEGPFVLAFGAPEAPGGQAQINALLARIASAIPMAAAHTVECAGNRCFCIRGHGMATREADAVGGLPCGAIALAIYGSQGTAAAGHHPTPGSADSFAKAGSSCCVNFPVLD